MRRRQLSAREWWIGIAIGYAVAFLHAYWILF